ncbi:hypothetical protein [Novosphingobium sp. BW1]|uniref:hypothetical protein n=1 Tax=Novosphingobium sp. BW1 TaxID=2592621 RepID=UPI0011DEF424|nr:hypothetical protein [Novosphingobium sp. BW1]TYC78789.1 hypothetical protein FMM79_20805 [Novosphingobium sp. BW1]
MAFSNPQVYIDELAAPLCRRFEAEPTAYDLAISTCIILYHFADVVAHVRNGKPHDVAQEIAAKVPAFHTVRAIANAGKHVKLTRHPKSELVGLRAEDLVRGKGAAFSDGSYYSDGTTHSDARETVVVATPDGKKHDVLHVCVSVLESLYREREFFEV